jgi:hypothetical protein
MKLIESFFYGIVAALGALIAELFVFIGISIHSGGISATSFSELFVLPSFIFVAACIEELLKYLVISKRKEVLSDKKSFFINSLFIGLGFFGVELAFLSASGTGLPAIQLLAEIAVVHIGTAGLIGYFVSAENPKKLSVFLPAVLLATLFHGSYNILAINRGTVENYIIFAILSLLFAFNIAFFLSIRKELAQD